jgi:hypothetical protein
MVTDIHTNRLQSALNKPRMSSEQNLAVPKLDLVPSKEV